MRYPQQADIRDYREAVLDSMARNPSKIHYGVIMDMRSVGASSLSSKGRQEAALLMKEHDAWFREVVVCSVRVTLNPIMRGALTVYDWISPAHWPRKSFSAGSLAETWARDRLAAAGIECPPKPVWQELAIKR